MVSSRGLYLSTFSADGSGARRRSGGVRGLLSLFLLQLRCHPTLRLRLHPDTFKHEMPRGAAQAKLRSLGSFECK